MTNEQARRACEQARWVAKLRKLQNNIERKMERLQSLEDEIVENNLEMCEILNFLEGEMDPEDFNDEFGYYP